MTFNFVFILTAVCETCLLQRLEEERLSQLVYQKAVIYVRQICPNDKNASFDADGPSPFVCSPVAAGSAATESGDPDFYVNTFLIHSMNVTANCSSKMNY